MIKISNLIPDKTALKHKLTGVHYLVSEIDSEKGITTLASSLGGFAEYATKFLSKNFVLTNGYTEDTLARIKISNLIPNKTILICKNSGVKYLVAITNLNFNLIRVKAPNGMYTDYTEEGLNQFFDISSGYPETSPKKSMIKFTYSVNAGPKQTMEFKNGLEMALFNASLVIKKNDDQDITIHSFSGPMYLGKMLYNEFTPEVK